MRNLDAGLGHVLGKEIKMSKATPTQLLKLFAIFVVGISASTFVAAYYPDSYTYVYVVYLP